MRSPVAAVALVVLLSTTAARAEQSPPTPQDRALAEALFQEGKALGEAGSIQAACLKFQESQRLDPALGTLLHLAACYEADGKTASAWGAFRAAANLAEQSGQQDRAALARSRADQLEAALCHVVVTVRDEDATVTLDGQELGKGAWGTKLPIDPGDHSVTAQAAGKASWSRELHVQPGDGFVTIEVPELEADRPAPPALADAPAPIENGDRKQRRTIAYAVGGAGVAALLIGSVFGIRAAKQKNDADEHCDGTQCTQAGLDGHSASRKSAWVANVGVGLGLAGIGVGTYFLVTARPAPAAAGQPAGWSSGALLSAGGTF